MVLWQATSANQLDENQTQEDVLSSKNGLRPVVLEEYRGDETVLRFQSATAFTIRFSKPCGSSCPETSG